MTTQPFTVADYLLTRLKQLNVTEVFQIPGDYVIGFRSRYEGLQRSFPTLEEARAHVEQLWSGGRSGRRGRVREQ